jgi:signal transduction histidine kinase
MIESRADEGQLEESTRAAIEALPEPHRSQLLGYIGRLTAELVDAPAADGDAGPGLDADADLERERTWVARELHDTIGGDLAASVALFKFYFENEAERDQREEVLRNIYEVLETTLANLRGMLRTLRTREVGPAGLVGDLNDMANAYQRFHGLDVLLKVQGDETQLTRVQQEAVFQVVREALSNVRRHSQSGTCLVTCNFAEQPFLVEIRDWGVGIVDQNSDGFGLIGMRERAAGIGGRIEVASVPGRGTTVVLVGPNSGWRH